MSVVLPFVVNAAVNFALGLLVALFLGPDEFGRYAIAAALMVLINVAALDWIKLAAIRYYAQGTDGDGVRSTLDGLAALVTLALSGLLAAAGFSGLDLGLPALLMVAAVATGLCGGLFEYGGAIARAQRRDRAYAALVLIKNALALVLMTGGAWWFRDATMVMAGNGLSVAAALLVVGRRLGGGQVALSGLSARRVRQFSSYAFPLVAANILYVSMPLASRTLLAHLHGFAEAGYFSLAADIGLKLFGALGAALEIVLLRMVVETDARDGRTAAEDCAARVFVIVTAVVAPVAAGLLLVMPAFEALLVPAAFRGHFAAQITPMVGGFALMSVMAAGITPLFMVRHRTWPTTLAAAVAVLANAVGLGVAAALGSPFAYAVSLGAAFVAAFAVLAALAWRATSARPSAAHLGSIALGLVALVAVVLPLRLWLPPAALLLTAVPLGALAYGAVLLAGDVAGCRSAWRDRRAARAVRLP